MRPCRATHSAVIVLALGVSWGAWAEPVVVEGVPRFGWTASKQCQQVGALWAALSAMGCPMGYEELLVASGTAFSTAWLPGRYHYGCLIVAPEDLLTEAARAAGAVMQRKSFPSREQAFVAIAESLKAGRPVWAWKGWGAQVICGYDPQTGQMLVQDWNSQTETYQAVRAELQESLWPARRANEIVLLEYDRARKPPDLDWPGILKRTVRLAEWPATRPLSSYVFGLAAYDAWARTLRKGADESGAHTDVGLLDDLAFVLADARSAASVVLRDNGTLHEALGEAANHYMAEAEIIKGLRRALGAEVGQAAEPAWSAMASSLGDPAAREEAAKVVEDAKAEEKLAVDALRRALKDLVPPEPPVVAAPPTPPAADTHRAEEAQQHLRRGIELKRAGKMREAAEELRAAIADDPKSADPHYALAWVLIALKDTQGAAAEFRKVIDLAPDSAQAAEAQRVLGRLR